MIHQKNYYLCLGLMSLDGLYQLIIISLLQDMWIETYMFSIPHDAQKLF